MRYFIAINILIFIFVSGSISLTSFSQTPKTQDQEQIESDRKIEADLDSRIGNMSNLENTPHEANISRQTRAGLKAQSEAFVAAQRIFAKLIEPDAVDKVKYKNTVASGRGGLFRLLSNHDCVTADLIRATGKGEGFVDGGSAYSFRSTKYYSIAGGHFSQYFLSDLQFDQDIIRSKGFLEHGIMTQLGDVAVETVELSDQGLKFLVDLKPSTVRSDADVFEASLDKTITRENYTYSNRISPQENMTYAMRIIAYKLKGLDFNGEPTVRGYKYMGLKRDKRADLTIVFRIVRRDADGNLTIVWRELKRTKAPMIKY